MRKATSSARFKEAFGRLPLAAQFVLSLSALIVAGLAVALAVDWQGQYAQTHWTPDRVWVELAVFSAVTLGALVVVFKIRWRRVRFWVTLVGAMAVRTAAYAAVLRQLPAPPPLMFFAAATMIDVQVWVIVLEWLNHGSVDVGR